MGWNYSNTSMETTLTASVNSSATTISVASTSGLPVSFPFSLILDFGEANAEVVTVTGLAGLNLTVTRGQDGTAAQSHNLGAKVVHGVVARDVREPQTHIDASQDVHGVGVGNSVVGTGTTQTLTNKTLTAPTVNGGTISGATIANAASITSDGAVDVVRSVGSDTVLTGKVTGDTFPRLRAKAEGTLSWGSGSASDDVNLYRSAANVLKTDDTFEAAAANIHGLVTLDRATAGDLIIAKQTADSNGRIFIRSDARIVFGDGAGATDTNIYRDSAGVLKTDSDLNVVGDIELASSLSTVRIGGTSSSAGFGAALSSANSSAFSSRVSGDSQNRFQVEADGDISWGSGSAAPDTNLFRSTANNLRTNDSLQVDGNLIVLGIGARVFARKTGDETISNNSSLQNDDHLSAAISPGTWELLLQITQNSGATPGFKMDFALPAATTWLHGFFTCGSSAATEQMGVTPDGVISGITGTGTESGLLLRGIVLITNSGTVQFRWAQNVANASNTIVRSGSSLMLTMVA